MDDAGQRDGAVFSDYANLVGANLRVPCELGQHVGLQLSIRFHRALPLAPHNIIVAAPK
jgi:hypothetical protein